MIDLIARAHPLSALGIVVAADTAPLLGDACSLKSDSIATLLIQIMALVVAWFVGIERGRKPPTSGGEK